MTPDETVVTGMNEWAMDAYLRDVPKACECTWSYTTCGGPAWIRVWINPLCTWHHNRGRRIRDAAA